MKVILAEAADIINIKISKNGGLYRSKKIAVLAESAGIPCLVGGATRMRLADRPADILQCQQPMPGWVLKAARQHPGPR